MAKYGSNSVGISFDNAAGSPVDMSQHVLTFNGIDIEAMTEESHSFGDSWVENLFTGLRKGADVNLGGFYDDAATTGPHVIFNDVGNTASVSAGPRTLTITWGGSKTTSFETWIKNYKRIPSRGELTKYEVTLLLSGAVTEA